MSEKYWKVMIEVEMVADSADDAKAATQELVNHVWKTGADSDLPCPWEMKVLDQVEFLEEV